MVRREQYRDAKGLMQRVEAMIRATLPRQAWVTRTEGSRVYVRFVGETVDDPESGFISTVAGVPVGTMGWVLRLAGKKGLFVATGVPAAMPFTSEPASGTQMETTNTATLAWFAGTPLILQPGAYRASGMAMLPVTRGIMSGGINGAIRVGGVESESYGINMLSEWGPHEANAFFTLPVPFDIEFTTEIETVDVDFGFRGSSTSGTTVIRRPAASGTLTRIG